MSDTVAPPVVGSERWWPIHRTELVGVARWLILAWAAQTLILAAVGLWIVAAIHAGSAQAHEDAKHLTDTVQNK